MSTEAEERIKKAYARLVGLKQGLEATDLVRLAQVNDFNKALDHLITAGFDVDEFRIAGDEVEDWEYQGKGTRWETFITRLNGVLAYFTVDETSPANAPPSRKIVFEGPRQTEKVRSSTNGREKRP